MAAHLGSVLILWLPLALCVVSICRGDVGDIATQDFFNGILSGASDTCAGKNFYKYSDFINAANAFSGFGTTGTSDDNKRELAAFFANVAHETGSRSHILSLSINIFFNMISEFIDIRIDRFVLRRGDKQKRLL